MNNASKSKNMQLYFSFSLCIIRLLFQSRELEFSKYCPCDLYYRADIIGASTVVKLAHVNIPPQALQRIEYQGTMWEFRSERVEKLNFSNFFFQESDCQTGQCAS